MHYSNMYTNFQIYLIPSGEIQLKFQVSDVTSKNGLKAYAKNKGSWTVLRCSWSQRLQPWMSRNQNVYLKNKEFVTKIRNDNFEDLKHQQSKNKHKSGTVKIYISSIFIAKSHNLHIYSYILSNMSPFTGSFYDFFQHV